MRLFENTEGLRARNEKNCDYGKKEEKAGTLGKTSLIEKKEKKGKRGTPRSTKKTDSRMGRGSREKEEGGGVVLSTGSGDDFDQRVIRKVEQKNGILLKGAGSEESWHKGGGGS